MWRLRHQWLSDGKLRVSHTVEDDHAVFVVRFYADDGGGVFDIDHMLSPVDDGQKYTQYYRSGADYRG